MGVEGFLSCRWQEGMREKFFQEDILKCFEFMMTSDLSSLPGLMSEETIFWAVAAFAGSGWKSLLAASARRFCSPG